MEPSTHDLVKEKYGRIAAGDGCGPKSSCCGGGRAAEVALGLGYSEAELATLPEGANLGLSCGNPTALAELKPGETVLDLGSGAGFDLFLAAQRVGPEGRAIGVDMTREMVARARLNAAEFQRRTGLDNVVFHLGQIELLPLADASVDVVISNCVLNLSPDQAAVWKEIARVLKPGGRVSISDMALHKRLPDPVRQSVEALVGCISGAPLVDDLRRMMTEAGLADLRLEPKAGAVAAMLAGDDPKARRLMELLPAGTQPGDFITSLVISARKPCPALRKRTPEDLDAVARLLEAVKLPAAGLDRTDGWVIQDGNRIVAHVAIERTPDAAVLRSIVVASDQRGRGLARRLLDAAEADAGQRTLVLKTDAVGPWVEGHGYRRVTRDQLPPSVLATTQFEGALCASYPIYLKR
jgi:ubiquinone/menaquinone biosynthesis C-methylase UbiE/N-acetylglutamate synthase-like GNAT family acetyltransferase